MTNNSTMVLHPNMSPSFVAGNQQGYFGQNDEKDIRDLSPGPNSSAILPPGRTSRLLTEMLAGFHQREDMDTSQSPMLTPKSPNMVLKDQTKKVMNTYYTKVPQPSASTTNLQGTVSPGAKPELRKQQTANNQSPLTKLQTGDLMAGGMSQPHISKLVLERSSPLTRGLQSDFFGANQPANAHQVGMGLWPSNQPMYRGPSEMMRALETSKKTSAAEEQAAKMKKLASGVSTRETVKDQLKRYDGLKLGQAVLKKGLADERKKPMGSTLYLGALDLKRFT